MQHSPDLAKVRYRLSSTRPCADLGATMAMALWLTWMSSSDCVRPDNDASG